MALPVMVPLLLPILAVPVASLCKVSVPLLFSVPLTLSTPLGVTVKLAPLIILMVVPAVTVWLLLSTGCCVAVGGTMAVSLAGKVPPTQLAPRLKSVLLLPVNNLLVRIFNN